LISTLIAGKIVGRVDGRFMIAAGFLIIATASFLLGNITFQISMSSAAWPNFIMGMAIGFIFVPMSTLSMGTLPNRQIGTAVGLYNLTRTLGGSVGIAMISTMLARDAQLHQALMVSHLTPYDPAFQTWFHHLLGFFSQQGDPVAAVREAYATIYKTLVRQATLWAYVDNFRFLAYLTLFGVPIALLFKIGAHKESVKTPVKD